jgi:signal transduction histidine kinase
MIPLLARGQRIGLVVLSDEEPHDWSEEDLWRYQTTAAQLASSIDGRRQQRLLYQRGQQLAVLEERQRLARELHDSVTQLIFSITLIAQSIAPAWRREPAEGEHRVQRLLELSQLALAEMRALLAELHPAEISESRWLPDLVRVEQEGLVSALRHHVVRVGKEGLQVQIQVQEGLDQIRLRRTHEEALFRIAQESLHNVVKHAGVQYARLTLRADPEMVYLSISDDGIGFDLQRHIPHGVVNGGLGLKSIGERVEALGGTFHLASTPGGGTRVEIKLPRKEQDG